MTNAEQWKILIALYSFYITPEERQLNHIRHMSIYDRAQETMKSSVDGAYDIIIDAMYDHGSYTINRMMYYMDISKYSTDILIGILVHSRRLANKLACRSIFYKDVGDLIRERLHWEPDLLKGLWYDYKKNTFV